ncbi:hypothetical protein N9H39_04040 [Gammaproteobacteria bacterium]|nr:hypothetical protein [Gammaproteobacteria bacterium]
MPFATVDVFRLVKEFIIELYERLPRSALRIGEPAIKGLKTFIYFVSEIKLQVLLFECSTENEEESFRMLYVGRTDQVQSILGLLKCRATSSVRLKSLFAWQLADYLDHRDVKPELSIIHVNNMLYRYLKPKGFFRIPASVKSVLILA